MSDASASPRVEIQVVAPGPERFLSGRQAWEGPVGAPAGIC